MLLSLLIRWSFVVLGLNHNYIYPTTNNVCVCHFRLPGIARLVVTASAVDCTNFGSGLIFFYRGLDAAFPTRSSALRSTRRLRWILLSRTERFMSDVFSCLPRIHLTCPTDVMLKPLTHALKSWRDNSWSTSGHQVKPGPRNTEKLHLEITIVGGGKKYVKFVSSTSYVVPRPHEGLL